MDWGNRLSGSNYRGDSLDHMEVYFLRKIHSLHLKTHNTIGIVYLDYRPYLCFRESMMLSSAFGGSLLSLVITYDKIP
jgi:hypothetical protein